MGAINDATGMIIDRYIDPIKTPEKYSFQSAQRVRDMLYTIVTRALGSPSADIVSYPTDYRHYALLYVFVGPNKVYCKPMDYNREGDTQIDPFSKPGDDLLYFNESDAGFHVSHGATALGSYELWYVRNPAVVSIGNDNNKIVAGTVLTALTSYTAYDTSVYNGTTYYPGDIITGTGATLTSGTVILTSVLVNSDLPDTLQNEVCELASAIMNETVENWYKKQSLQYDVDKY